MHVTQEIRKSLNCCESDHSGVKAGLARILFTGKPGDAVPRGISTPGADRAPGQVPTILRINGCNRLATARAVPAGVKDAPGPGHAALGFTISLNKA
jgi:hypothetical protein